LAIPIEVDRIIALPHQHSVRAFHGAGWVVPAPWVPTDGTSMLRVTGPGETARDFMPHEGSSSVTSPHALKTGHDEETPALAIR
jgi:hypothetical protein